MPNLDAAHMMLALMALTFWQLFAAKIVLGSTLAFAIAWCTKDRSSAYRRGWQWSLLVVLVSGCVPLLQSTAVSANRAADEFFWTLVPLLGAWLVGVAIAVEVARIVRWKE